MASAEELHLVQSAARQMFRADAGPERAPDAGWYGMLTEEALGGSGWHPLEACVVAEEAGAAHSPWHWSGGALAAAALASRPETRALAKEVVGGQTTANYCVADLDAPPSTGGTAPAATSTGGTAPAATSTGGTAPAATSTGGTSTAPERGNAQATGTARWVLGAPSDVVVVGAADDSAMFVLADGGEQRWSSPATVLDTARTVRRLRFRASAVEVPDGTVARLNATAVLLACADALGTLGAAAELVRTHLQERTAFGTRLASLQVLQHRLVALELLRRTARALVGRAGTLLASGSDSASAAVDAAHVYLEPRLRCALDDCIQLAGGIGFTWELPLHHGLRRVQTDFAAVRSAGRSAAGVLADRRWVAARSATGRAVTVRSATGGANAPGTNAPGTNAPGTNAPGTNAPRASTVLTAETERTAAFRAHVRSVIAEHAPPGESREGHRAPVDEQHEAELRRWYRILYREQVVGGGWPVEWGGDPDHDPLDDVVATEELIGARAPRPLDQVQLASHLLLAFGTESQKRRHLPAIRSARHIWCQLFSEPGAGSDLAGLATRARQTAAGTFVLQGQKTWTTDAHWADWGVALARTGEPGDRHRGLTAFLVDMKAPGITVRPIVTMGGAHELNDVFLDQVEVAPDDVLGAVGGGWEVAMSGLQAERYGVGGNVAMLQLLLEDLAACAAAVEGADGDARGGPFVADPLVLDRLCRLAAEVEAAISVVASHVDRAAEGRPDATDAAVGKILYSETYGRLAGYGMTLLTERGSADDLDHLPAARRLLDAWLWSRALTISGGSSEVMRNVIARRGLGLPDPRPR